MSRSLHWSLAILRQSETGALLVMFRLQRLEEAYGPLKVGVGEAKVSRPRICPLLEISAVHHISMAAII